MSIRACFGHTFILYVDGIDTFYYQDGHMAFMAETRGIAGNQYIVRLGVERFLNKQESRIAPFSIKEF